MYCAGARGDYGEVGGVGGGVGVGCRDGWWNVLLEGIEKDGSEVGHKPSGSMVYA